MKSVSLLCGAVLMVALATPVAAQGRGASGSAPPQGRGPAAPPSPAKPAAPPAKPAAPAAKPAAPPEKSTSAAAKPTSAPPTASEHLAKQPELAAKLQPLLPAGTDVQTAAAGFKTLGAFAAAVHVAKNLDIPFNPLKMKLTGATPEPLGQAIHDLKPTVNAQAEAKKALAQAKQDESTGKRRRP